MARFKITYRPSGLSGVVVVAGLSGWPDPSGWGGLGETQEIEAARYADSGEFIDFYNDANEQVLRVRTNWVLRIERVTR